MKHLHSKTVAGIIFLYRCKTSRIQCTFRCLTCTALLTLPCNRGWNFCIQTMDVRHGFRFRCVQLYYLHPISRPVSLIYLSIFLITNLAHRPATAPTTLFERHAASNGGSWKLCHCQGRLVPPYYANPKIYVRPATSAVQCDTAEFCDAPISSKFPCITIMWLSRTLADVSSGNTILQRLFYCKIHETIHETIEISGSTRMAEWQKSRGLGGTWKRTFA